MSRLLLPLVLSLAVCGAFGEGDTSEPETPNKPQPPKLAPVNYCDRGAYSCLTCSTGRVCVPTTDGQKYYEISRFACTDLHPYCNYTTGVCSDTPDPSCFDPTDEAVSSTFLCMRDGFYPDPKSCSKFYVCKNKVAYEHTCQSHPTPYYHPRLRHCVATDDFCADKTSAPFCKNEINHGRKVPVLYTNNYFMYCGEKEVLTVDRCIGAYFFDPVAQTCQFICSSEGVFQSMDDCTKYIECTPQPQGGFTRKDMTCPPGTAFLPSEFSCVDQARVTNCNYAHPDSYSK